MVSSSKVFGYGAGDPSVGLAQVVGGIKQTVQLSCRQLGGDLWLIRQYRPQVTALCDGTLAALLQQMVCGFATEALGKHDADGLGQYQAVGQVEVLRHALRIDFQAFAHQQRLM